MILQPDDPLLAKMRLPRPEPPEPKVWLTKMQSGYMCYMRNQRGFLEVTMIMYTDKDGNLLEYDGPATH